MGIHAHRRAAGLPRQHRPSHHFHYYGQEELIFDERRQACRVTFNEQPSSKDRESQILVSFLNIKQTEIVTNFLGEKFERTPILTLTLREIKQRIKDYSCIGKDTSALRAAKAACEKAYPTHRPLPN